MKRQKFEFSNITSLSLPWYNKYINLFMPSILQSSFHYLPLFLHSSLPPPIQDSLPPSMDLYLLSSSVSFTIPSFHSSLHFSVYLSFPQCISPFLPLSSPLSLLHSPPSINPSLHYYSYCCLCPSIHPNKFFPLNAPSTQTSVLSQFILPLIIITLPTANQKSQFIYKVPYELISPVVHLAPLPVSNFYKPSSPCQTCEL